MTKNLEQLDIYLESLKDKYVIHKQEYAYTGFGIYIMERYGNAFVRLFMDKDILYVDMLSVSFQYRKQGLATDLMKIAEQVAQFLLCDIWLWCKFNSQAYYWYERLGYEKECRHTELNHYWMTKSFNYSID